MAADYETVKDLLQRLENVRGERDKARKALADLGCYYTDRLKQAREDQDALRESLKQAREESHRLRVWVETYERALARRNDIIASLKRERDAFWRLWKEERGRRGL